MSEKKLKFRVWNPVERSFVKETRLFEAVRLSANGKHVWFDDNSPFEYQQYIGIRDLKGVEIFEGDILRLMDWGRDVKQLGIGTIIWNEYHAGWTTDPWFPFLEEASDFVKCLHRSRVIGNIFENRELLEDE